MKPSLRFTIQFFSAAIRHNHSFQTLLTLHIHFFATAMPSNELNAFRRPSQEATPSPFIPMPHFTAPDTLLTKHTQVSMGRSREAYQQQRLELANSSSWNNHSSVTLRALESACEIADEVMDLLQLHDKEDDEIKGTL